MFDPSGGFGVRPAPAVLGLQRRPWAWPPARPAGALPFDFLIERPAEKPDRRRSAALASWPATMAVVLAVWLGASSLGSERDKVTTHGTT